MVFENNVEDSWEVWGPRDLEGAVVTSAVGEGGK
jgi:hypothetical protein